MATGPDTSSYSDAQLLALHLQSGTNEYLGQLYARYIQLVYGVSLKYLRNVDDAGDAVTAIFEELAAKIGRYEIGEFRPWLYTVTKNYCMQKLRRKGHEISVDFSDRVMENAAFTHLLNEGTDEALLSALEKCIEKLPEKQRECIDLFFFNDKSYADITAATRYQLKNVKSYIQNGKRNLKICLDKGNHETD
jgi:RNA polymerase sigma-70 factor (ECF subfamily)